MICAVCKVSNTPESPLFPIITDEDPRLSSSSEPVCYRCLVWFMVNMNRDEINNTYALEVIEQMIHRPDWGWETPAA